MFAIVSFAVATGSVAAYSYLLVPSIRSSSTPAILAQQWRTGYLIGFRTVPRPVFPAGLAWACLAYDEPNGSPRTKPFIAAAILLPTIIPFTLTVQRRINAKLNYTSNKLIGKGKLSIAETHSAVPSEQDIGELVDEWSK